MSATITNKLSAAEVSDVLQRCNLPPEAQEAIAGMQDVMGIIQALTRAGFPIEATRVFAHALPKREAVWWACMCATHTSPANVTEGDRKARELSEAWVRQRTDEVRRAAMDEAKRTGFQSPEAWAAVAAFWSGDSLTPLNMPPVPPPAHLTGVAVAGAVALASVRGAPNRQKQRLALFLQSAHDIAAGGPGRLPVEAE
jgi:hypothetical protein